MMTTFGGPRNRHTHVRTHTCVRTPHAHRTHTARTPHAHRTHTARTPHAHRTHTARTLRPLYIGALLWQVAGSAGRDSRPKDTPFVSRCRRSSRSLREGVHARGNSRLHPLTHALVQQGLASHCLVLPDADCPIHLRCDCNPYNNQTRACSVPNQPPQPQPAPAPLPTPIPSYPHTPTPPCPIPKHHTPYPTRT
jgi:hypothetical protein